MKQVVLVTVTALAITSSAAWLNSKISHNFHANGTLPGFFGITARTGPNGEWRVA